MEANGIPHAPLEARRSLRVGLVRDIFDTVTRSKECLLNNFQLPASHIEPLFDTRHLGAVKAGRSPPEGEALTDPDCLVVVSHHRERPPSGGPGCLVVARHSGPHHCPYLGGQALGSAAGHSFVFPVRHMVCFGHSQAGSFK